MTDIDILARAKGIDAAAMAVYGLEKEQIEALGMTFPAFVDLRLTAWDEQALHRLDRPAPTMCRAIVNLHLRGLGPDDIRYGLSVPPVWVADALAQAQVSPSERAVVRAHLAGGMVAQIAAELGLPRTSVTRVVERRLGERARTNSRIGVAQRAAEVARLRAQGKTQSQIAAALGVPVATVKNDYRKGAVA